jgi:hypothetical protein
MQPTDAWFIPRIGESNFDTAQAFTSLTERIVTLLDPVTRTRKDLPDSLSDVGGSTNAPLGSRGESFPKILLPWRCANVSQSSSTVRSDFELGISPGSHPAAPSSHLPSLRPRTAFRAPPGYCTKCRSSACLVVPSSHHIISSRQRWTDVWKCYSALYGAILNFYSLSRLSNV